MTQDPGHSPQSTSPLLLSDLWDLLRAALFETPSGDRLFNPYHDAPDPFGLPDAPRIRQANLKNYLACYEARPRLLLVAEAPGPWGCRFSGVPLVSEAQLADDAFPIDGRPSSLQDTPHKEYSASIYWRVLGPYFPHFFTWNTVPFHPHRRGEPLTIRPPTAAEVRAHLGLLAGLVDLLRPERVVAVGRKAEGALQQVGIEATYVRHPSQGGARLFKNGVLGVARALRLAATRP